MPRRTLRRSGRINDANVDSGVEHLDVDSVSVVPEKLSGAIGILASQGAILFRYFDPDRVWNEKGGQFV